MYKSLLIKLLNHISEKLDCWTCVSFHPAMRRHSSSASSARGGEWLLGHTGKSQGSSGNREIAALVHRILKRGW